MSHYRPNSIRGNKVDLSRELFLPFFFGTEMVGTGYLVGARINADTEAAYTSWHTPTDFHSIVSADVWYSALAGVADMAFLVSSKIIGEGESKPDSDSMTVTRTVVIDTFYKDNVITALDGTTIHPSDLVFIAVSRPGGGNANMVAHGIKIKYRA